MKETLPSGADRLSTDLLPVQLREGAPTKEARVKAIATLLGLSAFFAGAACKEAWIDGGYGLNSAYGLKADHGALDLVFAIWCLVVAWRLDMRLRKST